MLTKYYINETTGCETASTILFLDIIIYMTYKIKLKCLSIYDN